MLRVGLLQLDIKIGDRVANRNNVEKWLERVMTPSEIPTAIVLPEIWDVGYALEQTSELADPEGENSVHFLGDLAQKYNIWFVGGSVLAKSGENFVNRAQVISPNGKLVTYYDKVHLIGLMDEDKYLVSGKKPCYFSIEGAKAGCVICYDIRFCEWLRTYAINGSEILFVSAEWPTARIDHWKNILKTRAIENQMYIVACNRVGTSKETLFGGASMVVDPWGKILYQAGCGEESGFITIDTEKVKEIRSYMPIFKDRVPELYLKQKE
ncbi:MAG: carbon-nitrogen family hydrolase [Aminobacterium sp.]|nr:carbon-nitrogen family hydrolase [Aminobacterium sp.]MEA4876975.1 carbon-nitrogen family hydrolase [Aminobacterium sp.]